MKLPPAFRPAFSGFVAVTIAASAAAQTVSSSATAARSEEVFTLSEFVVTTPAEDRSFKVDETLGAMRITTNILDTPINVSVINKQFIDDFLLLQDVDIMAHVAGAGLIGEPQQGTASTRIRGFGVPYYRNGFARIGTGEVVNMERVEIIKGPLAATFGRANPGGLVNYITQRPQRKPSYSARLVAGSYDYLRGEVHVTGPVLGSNKLFYRLDAAHTDLNGTQEFFYNRTWAASAAVTYEHSKDTSVTVEVEQLSRFMNSGTSAPVKQFPTFRSPVTGQNVTNMIGGIADDLVRRGFNAFGPHFNVHREASTLDLRLEHRINSIFSVRGNLQAWQRPFEAYRWTMTNYNVATGTFLARDGFGQPEADFFYGGQIDFLASFNTGRVPHKLLVSIDASQLQEVPNKLLALPAATLNTLPASSRILDPRNPNWYQFDRSELTRITTRNDLQVRLGSILISERIEPFHRKLLLFGSLRLERLDNEYVDYLNPANSAKKEATQPTYSVGGVARPFGEKLSFFGNISTGFTTSTTIDRGTGELQDNPRSRGVEFGVKGELLRGKVFWSTSAFFIRRHDIPQSNPLYVVEADGDFPVGVPQYVGSGEERIEGYEIEASGALSETLSFRTVFGHLDARTHRSMTDRLAEGVQLLNAPKKNLSLALTYRFKTPRLRGLAVGSSVAYVDSYLARYGRGGSEIAGTGNITDRLRLNYGPTNRIEEVRSSSTLFDGFASYAFTMGRYQHSVGLNVRNMTDREWWGPSGRLNDGRSYMVRYGVKF
jgi:iron complex outermembrane receptor protein